MKHTIVCFSWGELCERGVVRTRKGRCSPWPSVEEIIFGWLLVGLDAPKRLETWMTRNDRRGKMQGVCRAVGLGK